MPRAGDNAADPDKVRSSLPSTAVVMFTLAAPSVMVSVANDPREPSGRRTGVRETTA
jgi:hypothetical protein